MRFHQWALLSFAFAALSACASAPPARDAHIRTAPPPSLHASHLELCPGVSISNAPASDGARRIIAYEPYARVNGATLSRAPVSACVSSGFGPRRGGASGFHKGVDLYTRAPTTVFAGGDGVIEAVGTLRGYGRTITIRHASGVKTRYAHLSEYAPGVAPGARVSMGQAIGRTGATGNASAVHLHYEILVDGRPHNPLTIGS